MYTMHVEKRDTGIKSKQLRNSGFIPGNVYGGGLKESLLIQVPQTEAARLLKEKTAGNTISLLIGKKKYGVMLKEIGRDPASNKLEHLSFQNLDNSKTVATAARVVLLNREKVTNTIQQRLYDIPYKALPSDIVEEIVIDLDGMPVGTYLRVKDLDIAQNPDIELTIDPEDLVLSINESRLPTTTGAGSTTEITGESGTTETA